MLTIRVGLVSSETIVSHIIWVITQHVQLNVLIPVAQQQEQLSGCSLKPCHVQSLGQLLTAQP